MHLRATASAVAKAVFFCADPRNRACAPPQTGPFGGKIFRCRLARRRLPGDTSVQARDDASDFASHEAMSKKHSFLRFFFFTPPHRGRCRHDPSPPFPMDTRGRVGRAAAAAVEKNFAEVLTRPKTVIRFRAAESAAEASESDQYDSASDNKADRPSPGSGGRRARFPRKKALHPPYRTRVARRRGCFRICRGPRQKGPDKRIRFNAPGASTVACGSDSRG